MMETTGIEVIGGPIDGTVIPVIRFPPAQILTHFQPLGLAFGAIETDPTALPVTFEYELTIMSKFRLRYVYRPLVGKLRSTKP